MSAGWQGQEAVRGGKSPPAPPPVGLGAAAGLLDAARQAIIATDTERRIIFWNRAAETIYGWSSAEVLGRNILEITPLELEPAERVLAPVEHGGSWAGEFLSRRKNGETFSAFVTISPLHDEHGCPAGVLGLSFDLSGDVGNQAGSAAQASRMAAATTSPTEPKAHAALLARAGGLPAQLAIAGGLVLLATAARLGLGTIDPRVAPFTLYFPAILVAAALGGWRAGAAATALALAFTWALFLGAESTVPSSTALIDMTLYAGAAAAILAVAGHVRVLVRGQDESRRAVAEYSLHYDTLFQAMSEGFALCEAIRDQDGALADYTILEMNPALQRMLGVGPEVVGQLFSRTPGDNSVWLALCDKVMRSGAAQSFEFHNPATGRWHEIHINRVTQTRMAQLFFDITDRKLAEARQRELFDELNHRVKNNLTIVASVLSAQARGNPALHAELAKAVDRVQSIAQVHDALHGGDRNGEIDFAVYLRNLCDRLSRSLLDDDRIRIEVDAQSAPVSADHAVPLGMVVNELVTNAVKYAYPAPAGGVIRIGFHPTKTGALLSVGDSGRGLPADFENHVRGLGLRLLRSMIDQVGGKLTIRHSPGVTFEIHLPTADRG